MYPQNFELLALSLNNLGCLLKKEGRYADALSSLREGLKLAKMHSEAREFLGLSFLNLSAVYSQLSCFKKSKRFASKAIKVLSCDMTSDLKPEVLKEKASLLAISFYNVGAAYEFLKKHQECLDSYKRAIQILEANFSPDYPLTLQFKSNLAATI